MEQPQLARRPSLFRRLVRRLSVSSFAGNSRSRAETSLPGSLALSPPSRPVSRLTKLRRGSSAASSAALALPEEGHGNVVWPPTATLLRANGKHGEYDIAPLLQPHGGRCGDMWDNTGDVEVFLCAKEEAGKFKPSFCVSGEVLKRRGGEFFHAALSERWQDKETGARRRLFFPPDGAYKSQLELLQERIAVRNLFAFVLKNGRGFTVLDGAHGGFLLTAWVRKVQLYLLPPPPEKVLAKFVAAHGLDDPRASPARALDVLLASELGGLGRQVARESFLHAAGQYLSIRQLPEYLLLPASLQLDLQRAHHEIQVRVSRTTASLKSLLCPSLPGVPAGPKASKDGRSMLPKGWEDGFRSVRALIIQHYSSLFKSRGWPPKRFSRGMALMILRDVQLIISLLTAPRERAGSTTQHLSGQPSQPGTPGRMSRRRRGSAAPGRAGGDTTTDEEDDHRLDTDFYATLLSTLTNTSRRPLLPPPTASKGGKLSPDEAAFLVLNSWSASPDSNALVQKLRELEIRQATGKSEEDFVRMREGRWIGLWVVRRAVEGVVGRGEWEGVKWGWGVEYWVCCEGRRSEEDDEEEEGDEGDEGVWGEEQIRGVGMKAEEEVGYKEGGFVQEVIQSGSGRPSIFG